MTCARTWCCWPCDEEPWWILILYHNFNRLLATYLAPWGAAMTMSPLIRNGYRYSIPAIFAESESVSSGARRTMSWGRCRLGSQDSWRGECLKSWILRRVFQVMSRKKNWCRKATLIRLYDKAKSKNSIDVNITQFALYWIGMYGMTFHTRSIPYPIVEAFMDYGIWIECPTVCRRRLR